MTRCPAERHRQTLYVIAVLAVALALRLLVLSTRVCIDPDGTRYVGIARSWLKGGSLFDTLFPPLYPLLTAAAMLFHPDGDTAARLVSITMGTLVVLLIYLIALRLFDRRTALYAACVAAIHPMLAHYAAAALSESTYAAILLVGFVLALRHLNSLGLVRCAVLGSVLGLACLTRPEAAGYLPVFGGAVVWFAWRHHPRGQWLPAVGHLAVLLAAFLLVVAPYAAYLKEATGSWAISGKASHLLIKARAVGDTDPLAEERLLNGAHQAGETAGLLGELWSNPLSMARRYIINLHLGHKYTLYSLFPPLLLFALLIGAFQLRISAQVLFILGSLLPLVFIPLLLEEMGPRFFFMALPLGVILAARGVADLQLRLDPFLPPVLRRPGSVLVIAVVGLTLLPYTLRPLVRPDMNRIYRRAGEWLGKNTNAPPRVVFRKPWVAYYAGAQRLDMPLGGIEDLVTHAKRHRATHIVVDSRVVASARPELVALLNPDLAPPALRLVKRFTDRYYGTEALIYAFDPIGR